MCCSQVTENFHQIKLHPTDLITSENLYIYITHKLNIRLVSLCGGYARELTF